MPVCFGKKISADSKNDDRLKNGPRSTAMDKSYLQIFAKEKHSDFWNQVKHMMKSRFEETNKSEKNA